MTPQSITVLVDRIQTDLHRFKPSSCDFLIIEQINP